MTSIPIEIFIEIIQNILDSMISLGQMMQAMRGCQILYNHMYPEADPKSFKSRYMWALILSKLGQRIMPVFPPKEISAYSGLFELAYAYTKICSNKSKYSWNKYRIYKDIVGNRYMMLENTGQAHYIYNSISISNRYFMNIKHDTISIHTDTPWNSDHLIFFHKFDGKRINSSCIMEIVDGLLIEIDQQVFYLDPIDKSFKEIYSEFDHKRIGSGGYYSENSMISYRTGETVPVPISGCFRIANVCIAGVPGYDILLLDDAREIVYDSMKAEVKWTTVISDVSTEDIIDSLLFGGKEIRDLYTGQILLNIEAVGGQSIVGVTRKDDRTGYFVWLDGNNLSNKTRDMIRRSFLEQRRDISVLENISEIHCFKE